MMTRKARGTTRARLRRKDSFFGLHFDFHASDDCKDIGRRVTPRMIRELCRIVKPDYLQCDCKGHRGLSSYPTKVGNPAPGFVRDPLRIWRDVTAQEGIALYMHYSGVWDNEAIKQHPSWAQVDEKGKRRTRETSVFGPYVDCLLIPQLKELSDAYDVDGVWIDGDCWAAAMPDYSPRALEAFRRETGIRNVPRKPGDPHYQEFREFCREGFRRYLAHYVDALHAHNSKFQVCCNWSYSAFMPEPVRTNVDFLSGDYSLQDSVNTARMDARYLSVQGKPWDLMAWSFSGADGVFTTKPLEQLQQEAAVVLSLGGGFQAYVQQRRDASVTPWMLGRLGALARFCRERQSLCHQSTAVPQIGLIFAKSWIYRSAKRIFGWWNDDLNPLRGMLKALLEGQNTVDLVSEHHLQGVRHGYPLLILSETDYIAPAFRRDLLEYVREGGNLIVQGPLAVKMFRKELGYREVGPADMRTCWLEFDGVPAGMKTLCQTVKPGKGAKVFGRLHKTNDITADPEPAACIAKLGKGRIAGVFFNMGERYWNASTTVTRDFLQALVGELLPDPVAEVTGSHNVDVVLRRKNGALQVHLVNTAGPHANMKIFTCDEIPPLGPLSVKIKSRMRPKSVTLEPEHRKLGFSYSGGRVCVIVPKLTMHSAVVVK